VSGHHDGILVWNVESGAIKFALRRHDGRISDVAFSPDGRTLFSGSKDSTVRLWHTATGEYMGILYSAANARNDDLAANPWMEYVNVTRDGKYIIASCDDEQANETTLIVWSSEHCEQ
jgi:WD40 repeat protein